MSYWYIAHDDELLLDIDEYTRPAKDGSPWGEVFFRRRLREAINAGKLAVKTVHLARSVTPRHFQIFVKLKSPMPLFERLVWQLHLGSDLYRGRADLMRAARGFPAPSLLIRSTPVPNFYHRCFDAVCPCTSKHLSGDVSTHCEIFKRYRGMSPWELFGPSSTDRERFIALPEGNVPLSKILKKVLDTP
ncbi:MAG: hypothetical protein C5B59_12345 [Bacteroidetes bacterium]|nr:MAG: hypothetical protein C5B59_12345 [Bacteroidota bacterium]